MTDHPAPRKNKINAPFFEALNRDKLVLQRCLSSECGRFFYFPRVCCPHCQGGEFEWAPVSGRGSVLSYAVIHRPQHESFLPEAPYLFAAVKLEEGPLMYSRLTDDPETDENLMGRDVEVRFVNYTADQKLPFFVLS